MILKVRGSLEIAHSLPNYEGKCTKLHGHTLNYIFNFKGDVGEDGMVEDFKSLDRIIKLVIDKYDHTYLNDFIDNPTLENFAQDLLFNANNTYSYLKGFGKRGQFISLEVWETNKYGLVVTLKDLED